MDWNGRPLPWRCSDTDKFAEAIFDLNRCVTISCVSSLPLTSTFSISVVRSFCLLVSFRLTLWLSLRSVLPRLRGDSFSINGSFRNATFPVVSIPATPVTEPVLRSPLLIFLPLLQFLSNQRSSRHVVVVGAKLYQISGVGQERWVEFLPLDAALRYDVVPLCGGP
ncbi:uncharacterized protein METZ01_LOCUS279796, partial [marine metagenome]